MPRGRCVATSGIEWQKRATRAVHIDVSEEELCAVSLVKNECYTLTSPDG